MTGSPWHQYCSRMDMTVSSTVYIKCGIYLLYSTCSLLPVCTRVTFMLLVPECILSHNCLYKSGPMFPVPEFILLMTVQNSTRGDYMLSTRARVNSYLYQPKSGLHDPSTRARVNSYLYQHKSGLRVPSTRARVNSYL